MTLVNNAWPASPDLVDTGFAGQPLRITQNTYFTQNLVGAWAFGNSGDYSVPGMIDCPPLVPQQTKLIYGSTTLTRTAMRGRCLSPSGTGGGAAHTNSARFDWGANNGYTMAMLVRTNMNGNPSTNNYMFHLGTTAAYFCRMFYNSTGQLRIQHRNTSDGVTLNANTPGTSAGQLWCIVSGCHNGAIDSNVPWTIDGSNASAYLAVNGQLQDMTASTMKDVSETANLTVGSQNGTAAGEFNALIHSCFVWNEGLPPLAGAHLSGHYFKELFQTQTHRRKPYLFVGATSVGGGGPSYVNGTGTAAGTSTASGTLSDGAGAWAPVAYLSDLPPDGKGELFTHNGTAHTSLSPGPNGEFLVANSGAAAGLEYRNITDYGTISTLNGSTDTIWIHDFSTSTMGKMTGSAFFEEMGVPKNLSGLDHPFTVTGPDGEFIITEALTSNADYLFRLEDQSSNDLILVEGSGNSTNVIIEPGSFLDLVGAPLRVSEITAPTTPATGKGYFYATTTGPKFKGDNGTEIDLSPSEGSDYAVGDHQHFPINSLFAAGTSVFDVNGEFDPSEWTFAESVGDGFRPYVKHTVTGITQTRRVGIMFYVPAGYVSGTHTLAVVVNCRVGDSASGNHTMDVKAWESVSAGGTAGSDLVTTTEIVINTTWTERVFNVGDSGLSAGDYLTVEVASTIDDNGTQTGRTDIDAIFLRVGT